MTQDWEDREREPRRVKGSRVTGICILIGCTFWYLLPYLPQLMNWYGQIFSMTPKR